MLEKRVNFQDDGAMLRVLYPTRGLATAMLLATIMVPLLAAAASRGISVNIRASESADAPVSDTVELYDKSHALVIGIDDYNNGWPRLSNAIRDAELIAADLESKGFDVELHRNLTAEELNTVFRRFFIIKGNDPDARLFIWFAGHGATVEGEGYLIPADAPVPNEGGAKFKLVSVALRDFGTYMRQAVSKHVYAVFDSCFAGTVFSSQRALPPAAITRATTMPVRQFLTSGDADQTVSDDGTFRELFLRAINGDERADANLDGYVTGSELGMFLGDRVTNLTQSQQTPRFGKLRDKNFDRGDFVFLLPGGAAEAAAVASATSGDGTSRGGQGAEIAFWNSIKDSSSVEQFNAYLNQYPGGSFAALALLRKTELEREARRATVEQERARAREAFTVDFIDQPMVADRVANVRETPFPSAPRVGQLEAGASVWAIGQTDTEGGRWYKVARDGVELGFVYGPLLEPTSDLYTSIDVKPLPLEGTLIATATQAGPPESMTDASPVGDSVDGKLSEALGDLLTGVEDDAASDVISGVEASSTAPVVTAAGGSSQILGIVEVGSAEPMTSVEEEVQEVAMIGDRAPEPAPARSETVDRFIRAALAGNSKAQLSLGYMYDTGEQVEVDKQEAVRWYSMAAESGEIDAMISLALMYESGDGLARDLGQAAAWYEKAADLGNADAQQTLGYMYESGSGVSKDIVEAARWYEAAARQGRVAAQNNLGRLYQLGLGVAQDVERATFWYQQAAAQGSTAAQDNLANLEAQVVPQ